MNYFNSKIPLVSAMLLLFISLSLSSQPFPIELVGNGGDVYVNSTAVDADGNIYITGSLAPYVDFRFDPCGAPISSPDGAAYTRVFIAKLDPSGSTVLWLVTSTSQPYGNIFAGNDIELDSEGNVYVVGTIFGSAVTFTNVGSGAFISSCGNGERHFVTRISSAGTPAWISETSSTLPSYGEGITIDEDYGRLHTGGYVGQAGSGAVVNFPDADCTGGCNFTVSVPGGYGSPNVGFIATYNLADGDNTGSYQMGERVMDLDMDRYETSNIWITGSRHDVGSPDRDILFAKVQLNVVPCGPLTIDYSIPVSDGAAPGGDMGLDITSTWDDKVVFVGNFTNLTNFPSGGVLTAGAGNSDHFVASWDPVALTFTSVRTTTSYGPATVNTDYYMNRTICVASPFTSSAKVAIAYDKDVFTDGTSAVSGAIITRLLQVDLTDLAMTGFSASLPPGGPYSLLSPHARAMEIVFDQATDDKYLVGDHTANLNIGGCALVGGVSQKNGYISRINDLHTMFYKKDPAISSQELKSEQPGEIEIFPNPSQGLVQISGLTVGAEVELMDLSGKTIIRRTVNSAHETLNLSEFKNGMYLIRIHHNEEVKTFKLTLE